MHLVAVFKAQFQQIIFAKLRFELGLRLFRDPANDNKVVVVAGRVAADSGEIHVFLCEQGVYLLDFAGLAAHERFHVGFCLRHNGLLRIALFAQFFHGFFRRAGHGFQRHLFKFQAVKNPVHFAGIGNRCKVQAPLTFFIRHTGG